MGSGHVTGVRVWRTSSKHVESVIEYTSVALVQNLQLWCPVSRQRIETWVVWSLAVVLPGGLAILALWLSFRSAKRRAALRASAQRLSQPVILSKAAALASCPAE